MHNLLSAFRTYLLVERGLGQSTVNQYASLISRLDTYLAVEHGGLALAQAHKAELTAFLRSHVGERSAPSRSAWNNAVSALRAFYGYLYSHEVIESSPAEQIERLRVKRRERFPLSLTEAIALVGVARECSTEHYQSRNVALAQVLIHCGLRVAEVASLSVAQVDLSNRVFLSVRTKGDQRLSVMFNDVVAEALEEYLVDRPNLGAPESEPALFVSSHRRKMSVRSVQNLVKGWGIKAGVTRTVTPHILRHSTATLLVDEAHAELAAVKDHLGHASIMTTERYVHAAGHERRRAVNALGHAWQRATAPERRKKLKTDVMPVAAAP